MRPKALDLFCGAGGAGMGYYLAGFDVYGVDLNPQPNYPFAFSQEDALDVDLSGYDFVHASPPCQGYSVMSSCRAGLAESYPKLIEPMRRRLQEWGGPYIIENVVGAPLLSPVLLCGTMFGRETYRHRLFESNVPLGAPVHPKHLIRSSKAGHWKPGTFISVAGNCSPIAKAREAMGIDWTTRSELAEAIPPAFTEYLGRQILSRYKFCEKAVAPTCKICNITTQNQNKLNHNTMSPRFELAIAAACAAFAAAYNGTASAIAPEPAPEQAKNPATTKTKAPEKAKAAALAPAPVSEPETPAHVNVATSEDVLAAMKKVIAKGSEAGAKATEVLKKYGAAKRSDLKPEQFDAVLAEFEAIANETSLTD